MKHICTNGLHKNPIEVSLVGCGGTGSLVLSGLVRLHIAMKSLGHPYGIKLSAWDPDRVSPANIGRQLFTENEVALNKAEALIHRYNMHFGLDWSAIPEHYSLSHRENSPHLIISCVDTTRSRAEINKLLECMHKTYVIDGGNDRHTAQVLIGNGSRELPYPYQRIPELIDPKADVSNRPSCSLAEALEHQDLFINQWVATAILQLFWQLFRKGGLDIAGYFINLESGRMNPIRIT